MYHRMALNLQQPQGALKLLEIQRKFVKLTKLELHEGENRKIIRKLCYLTTHYGIVVRMD